MAKHADAEHAHVSPSTVVTAAAGGFSLGSQQDRRRRRPRRWTMRRGGEGRFASLGSLAEKKTPAAFASPPSSPSTLWWVKKALSYLERERERGAVASSKLPRAGHFPCKSRTRGRGPLGTISRWQVTQRHFLATFRAN